MAERDRKVWTKEEIEFLEDKYGMLTPKTIAKKLDRTEAAVISKRSREFISNAIENSGYVTLRQVLDIILGYHDNSKKMDKMIALGLPVHKVRTSQRVFIAVNIDKFWKWLEFNQSIISFHNFKENSLGKEPQWVKDKMAYDKLHYEKRWTESEVIILKSMLKQHKFTYEDICKRLGRTKSAIDRKIYRLGILDRPI